ncbi:hypothetical protein BJF83_00345 [Nocardiopsis sp. CNR-923]|nr:hypothetical protein BJF83_00345 [Nocardiopsis sp. CNR-923]
MTPTTTMAMPVNTQVWSVPIENAAPVLYTSVNRRRPPMTSTLSPSDRADSAHCLVARSASTATSATSSRYGYLRGRAATVSGVVMLLSPEGSTSVSDAPRAVCR